MKEISGNVVLAAGHLEEQRDLLLKRDGFSFDVETVGEHRGIARQNQVTWMSMASDGVALAIPMGHPNGNRMVRKATRRKNDRGKWEAVPPVYDDPPDQLRPSQVFDILQPLMFSEDHEKVAQNMPFDAGSIAKYYGGRIIPPPYGDTLVLSWLCDENKRHGLKDQTLAEYRRKYDRENVGRRVEVHPFNKVARYAYLDAKFTWLHRQTKLERLRAEDDRDGSTGLEDVLALEYEVLRVLLGFPGIHVDVDAMEGLLAELRPKRVEIEGRIYRAAGKKFNVNSNPQRVQTIYGDRVDGGQGLKPWRLTKGGAAKKEKAEKSGREFVPELTDYSTDKEALESYPRNKVAQTLLEYQEVDRVIGTYLEGYLGVDDPDKPKPRIIFDGLVFPDFAQTGTVTGRFSCRSPNLQNIPRPNTELGRKVRGLFVAPDGHRLVVADYGQVELVVLAHFAGPGALWDGFIEGIDPHTVTAAMVFGVDTKDVTPTQRQDAKNINFAVVYGAGTKKVAAMSKTTEAKAKAMLSRHEREFPEIYDFKDRVIRTLRDREHPFIRTIAGRKRRLPTIHARDGKVRSRAERQAVNSLIQGSSADLIKTAMVRLDAAFREPDEGYRIRLTVHDELVSTAETRRAEECAELVREAMIGDGIQSMVRVPLTLDLNIVERWSDAK